MATVATLQERVELVRARVHGWWSARKPLRIVRADQARHKDIALSNTTIQLSPEQLERARKLKTEAHETPA